MTACCCGSDAGGSTRLPSHPSAVPRCRRSQLLTSAAPFKTTISERLRTMAASLCSVDPRPRDGLLERFRWD